MKMKISKWASAALLVCGTSLAMAFPDKTVTMIVPFGAGSSVDVHARDLAQAMGPIVGQTVIVDNRAGAEGSIGAMGTLRAPADGHTLMFTSSSIPVLDPVMKKTMQYDPVKDFTPICVLGRASNVVNITGTSSIKTAAELIAAAKAAPGKITFGYSTASTRLAGELFQQAAGIKLTGIPYKASVAGLTDVAGGIVDLIFIDDVSAAAFYQGDRIRPLAVAGSERVRALPNVPTATEIGVPGYAIQPWFGVYVSAKTPPDLVAQLRDQMTRAMKSPIAVANFEKRGLVPLSVCGNAMTDLQNSEIQIWRGVMQKAGIEPQ
jgi:tripartite-type tricarboxylate transporter receptor subunit TctC